MNAVKWRLLGVLAIVLLGLYTVMPTIIYFSMPKETRNDSEQFQAHLPKWLPKSHVKLGLDIQGGVQLVLGVDAISAVEGKLGHLAVDITRWGTDKDQPVATAYAVKGEQKLAVEIKEGSDKEKFRAEFKKEFSGLEGKGTDGNKFYFGFSDSDIKRTKQSF